MVDARIHALLRFSDKISSILSIFFNSFLILLIITKSPKTLGAYKFLMIFISSFEICFSILVALVVPIHYTYSSTSVVLVNTTDKVLSPETLLVLNSFYWAFFGASMAIFAVQFVYRYLVLSMSPLIKTFSTWKISVWLSIPMTTGVLWALTGYLLCQPTREITESIRQNIMDTFGDDIDDFVYLGTIIQQVDENGDATWNKEALLAMSILVVSVSCSFFLITFFGIKCYLIVDNMMNISSTASSHFEKLQSQLFYALVFQTLIPILLLHTPVNFMMICSLLDHGIGQFTIIVSVTIALYPVIDPLPSFYIISPYRQAISGMFTRATVTLQ